MLADTAKFRHQPVENPERNSSHSARWLPYVAPMAAFLALTTIESWAAPANYVWLYLVKVIVVTGIVIGFRQPWREIQPQAKLLLPAVSVGLAIFVQWILLDQWIPYPHLGDRIGFNPFAAITDPALRTLFLTARFYGLVILVPVIEELFWRSFLLRYFSDPDFTRLAVGTFSWQAFCFVAIAFGLAHPEWLVAVIAACAYALLLRQTKSLFACIVAHSITNLALGLYVVLTQDWRYW
jgi:hypothetical protein